ncbi:MAG: DNA topoisomerase, partial [bacterium]|nr:DNA topoisomerase [bacterium]
LKVIQELYEKKLVTYPRTDARVLSSAVAKEISKNLSGLQRFAPMAAFAKEILEGGWAKGIAKTRYVNDKQITDHYAIIPTGQGLGAYSSLSETAQKIYQLICRRFLSIFYPPAVYQKIALEIVVGGEHFFASYRILLEEGYYKVAGVPKEAAKTAAARTKKTANAKKDETEESSEMAEASPALVQALSRLKKGQVLPLQQFVIKEGETSPPKRYNSGSMILAMENAGQLIEDEELRAQIKGSGIGTSATRADILKKLVNIRYLELNKKTQVVTPTLLGELVFEVVQVSMKQLLNPELTASWEKGLTYVAEGSITPTEYMQKLERFVAGRTVQAGSQNHSYALKPFFDKAAKYHKEPVFEEK